MNSILDLFLGDPVLDRRERVVRRDFAIKNTVAIWLPVHASSLLFSKNKILSGKNKKGKMKGGSNGPEARASDGPPGTGASTGDKFWLVIFGALIVGGLGYAVFYGFGSLIVSCANGRC